MQSSECFTKYYECDKIPGYSNEAGRRTDSIYKVLTHISVRSILGIKVMLVNSYNPRPKSPGWLRDEEVVQRIRC